MTPTARLRRRVVVAVTLLTAPVALQAGEGFYLGLFGGANDLEDQSFKTSDYALVPDGIVLSRIESDMGWLAGLAMGFSAGPLRPELEFAYRRNDVDKQRDTNLGLLGDISVTDAISKTSGTQAISGMANLWLDLFKETAFHPYLGGGVGGVDYRLKHQRYQGQDLDEDKDLVFAYQFGGGFGFDLGEQLELSLDYRWLRAEKAKFEPFPDTEGRLEERYEAQSAMLTLRYYFARTEEPIPPAEPVPVEVVPMLPPPVIAEPPPPPPPSCLPPEPGQPFTMDGCKIGDVLVLHGVNFLFDKSSLTLNAKALLDQVAQALKLRTDLRIELDGHTDSKGSDAYNQRLSQNRAESVRQYLIGQGVGASRLTAAGLGETSPVADNETDAGREANRRVELKILESRGGVVVAPPAAAADGSSSDAMPGASPP